MSVYRLSILKVNPSVSSTRGKIYTTFERMIVTSSFRVDSQKSVSRPRGSNVYSPYGRATVSLFRFADKSRFHLLDELVEEDVGQLRVESRFELKRQVEIDRSRTRCMFGARVEPPRCREVVEEFAIRTVSFDLRLQGIRRNENGKRRNCGVIMENFKFFRSGKYK